MDFIYMDNAAGTKLLEEVFEEMVPYFTSDFGNPSSIHTAGLKPRKAVEQGEENLRVSQERYMAQVTTITEVLDAQTRLSQSRLNYYRALYGHNLAKARLQRAVGEY